MNSNIKRLFMVTDLELANEILALTDLEKEIVAVYRVGKFHDKDGSREYVANWQILFNEPHTYHNNNH